MLVTELANSPAWVRVTVTDNPFIPSEIIWAVRELDEQLALQDTVMELPLVFVDVNHEMSSVTFQPAPELTLKIDVPDDGPADMVFGLTTNWPYVK